MDSLASRFPSRFSVYYVLDQVTTWGFIILEIYSAVSCRFTISLCSVQPPEGWDGGVGFVTEEMIRLHCPGPSPNVRVGMHALLHSFFFLCKRKFVLKAGIVVHFATDIEVRTTPHEQSYGCLPQNYWLYFPNAVPVLIQPTPLFTLLFALLARSNSIFPSPSQKQLK